jgi:hypothetical protein
MIKIANKEHFKEAIRFAKTLPKSSRSSLRHSFRTLNRIKRNGMRETGELVVLFLNPDWVNHSWAFQFMTLSGNKPWFHGGLILHGFEETYSVELNPANGPHWSIHT